ncbi:HAD hydrolase/ IA/ variant 1 family protein [Synechococcus sp. PROS-7-1]|uniref:HAD family hydrolase n=1 Tax=Synechococcus sp. PROS-7-1 TaxID=1442556 RepID=UPI001645AA57|nr:HAD family phosphatase [Synechococcus sp. PROS-7-1]QNI83921.1 HAD hydrolase/ IA/ variant 1 family protein [Synechococcus sp. PROS-7-1]
MIKAILFDMDGVLIDARNWHYDALNRALELFGYTISPESHLSTFDGLPTREKLKILSKTRGLPEGLHEFLNTLKQTFTLEISYQHCKPKFNHQYALKNLKADGYQIAVCSNSIRKTIETMMDLASLSDNLDMIVSNQDVKNGKPDPEMYLKAMASLEVDPCECLILEDNPHGIQAAIASGGHLLKVATPDEVSYQAIQRRILEIEEF